MSDHTSFCEWLRRNRAALSSEAFTAGERLACWLFLLESGEASAESRRHAAEALSEFMDYYQPSKPREPSLL